MNGRETVDALHHSTMHGEPVAHPDRLLAFQPLDPRNRPAPFKTYSGVDARPLPRELRPSSLPAGDVLSGLRADTGGLDDARLDDGLLGTLLFLAAGVNRVAPGAGGEPIWFRTAMSAGNLHPIEVYVIDDGVHHYQPQDHALARLRRGVRVGDGTTLVLTGISFRTCWKYGERGWRHLWWDAGTLLANLLAAADAHAVPARVLTAFPDAAVAALVGIDGVDEMPLAVVHLGKGEIHLPSPEALGPITVEASPVAPHPLRFPLVVDAQRRTELDVHDVAGWQHTAVGMGRPAPQKVTPPAGPDPDDRIEDVICRRGATRMFHQETAPSSLLEWGLAAASRAVPSDATAGGTLLDHLVVVHDIASIGPGRYRYEAAGGMQDHVPDDDPRASGARLCLGQPLGGDSAYTAFHAVALDRLLDNLGGRGYRAAHLEAGIAAGRLSLASVALGCGATGLTFYDGEVSRYFGTDAAPLLATAVGVPATGPAPYGGPGAPAELRGYGRIMTRLAASLRRRSR
jgi:SagB-type dehydrogenase family enzyme